MNAPMARGRQEGPHGDPSSCVAGFSLVELLIAITILLIIALTVTGVFTPMISTSQTDVLKANLRAIRKAIHQFYNDQGRYPYEGQDSFGNIVAVLDDNSSELVQGPHSGPGAYGARRTRYLLGIPIDPTLEVEEQRAAGWRLVYTDPGEGGGQVKTARQVKDVRSLNPRYGDW